jgi:UDP-N-acetylmuramate dehydrogenase
MVVARTDDDLIAAVAAADAAGEPVLLVGGGSNLVVADEGFDGVMIQVATRGVISDVSDCAGAVVTVAAGEPWDGVVDHAVQQGWIGLEALSGIPGLTGATPIQNVGAYGADVSQTISQVRTWDRCERTFRTFPAVDCAFSYRSSRFKAEPDRYLVVSVSYQLRLGDLSAPVRYADLARHLGVEVGTRVSARSIREAVLAVRRSKGMVLDDADHDTWSAGSFFTNPVLESSAADRLPADAPRHLQPDGTVKTSAAWLIEHAGYGRGYHLAGAGEPRAALSTKHTLAVTNRGSARTRDVLDLARTVRDGVDAAYGVVLEPEPVLVGCRL